MIYNSVKFYKEKMKKSVEEMEAAIAVTTNRPSRSFLPCEVRMKDAKAKFDKGKYLCGEYN